VVDRVVFYWSGAVPLIGQLSIGSALARFPEAEVHLWLDTDAGYESRLPEEFDWVRKHPRFTLRFFSLEEMVISCGFRGYEPQRDLLERCGHFLFQKFHNGTLRKKSWVTRVGPQNRLFRAFLGYHNPIYGWFRSGSVSHSIIWGGAVYRDDLFKTIIEQQYPGRSLICSDLDVYFAAHSNRWPFEHSFVSRWGDAHWANNPVVFLQASRDTLSSGFRSSLSRRVPALPWHFFSDERCADYGVRILPVELFDPGWAPTSVSAGRSDLFFSATKTSRTFVAEIESRSLAVHWHNQWSKEPDLDSPFDFLMKKTRQELLENP
jgi:hypothetical protein